MVDAVVEAHALFNKRGEASAKATPMQQPENVTVVLGMHRSGTSLCSNILSMLGVDMTDRITAVGHPHFGPDNPKGHWERWEIVQFHDRILKLLDRGYYAPFHDLPFPPAWWADPRVVEMRRGMLEFLQEQIVSRRFGFKDPRTIRFLPLWNQIFDDIGLQPKFILCVRNPRQVGRSVAARDKLPQTAGEYRWLVHMMDFFRYARESTEFCVIEYEKWFADPRHNLSKLERFIGTQAGFNELELESALSHIIDPALRHDDTEGEPRLRVARSLYHLVVRADSDRAARHEIAGLVAHYTAFQEANRPLQELFEEYGKAAERLPEMETRLAALQAEIEQRDRALAEALNRAGIAEGRASELESKLEAQRAAADAVESDRDQVVFELIGAQTKAAQLEGELAKSRRELEELKQAHQQAEAHAAASAMQLDLGADDASNGPMALDDIDGLEREQDEAPKRLAEKTAAVAAVESRAAQAIRDVEELRTLLIALERERDGLAAERAASEAAKDAAKLLAEQVTAELAARHATIREIEGDRARLVVEAARLRNEGTDAAAKIAALEAQIEALEAEFAQHESDALAGPSPAAFAELARILDRCETGLSELLAERTAIEARVTAALALAQQQPHTQEMIAGLRSRLADSEAQLSALRLDLADAERRARQTRDDDGEIDRYRNLLARAEQQRADGAARAQQEIAQHRAALQSAEQQRGDEAARAQQEVAQHRAALRSAEQQIAELGEQLEQRQRMIDELLAALRVDFTANLPPLPARRPWYARFRFW